MRLRVKNKAIQTRFTIGIDTAIYAVDDLMGGANALTRTQSPRGTLIINAVSVVDQALQNSPLLIVFYTDTTTGVGTNNSPINIADVALRSTCRGVVPIGSSDYVTTASNSFANKTGINIILPSTGTLSPGFFLICKGTPTYGAATDLGVIIHGYIK